MEGSAKRLKRQEKLERRKEVDKLIKAASANSDDLSSFPHFRHFDRNGINLCLESRRGDKLSASLKQYISNLLKENMEDLFGAEWTTEWKMKKRDMISPEARYIFVRRSQESGAGDISTESMSGVQGRGLGNFLMRLIEIIARKNQLGAVVLTVQKTNLTALNFYISKFGYTISCISPSRVDALGGLEKSYEILCKTFDKEAKASLEEIVKVGLDIDAAGIIFSHSFRRVVGRGDSVSF